MDTPQGILIVGGTGHVGLALARDLATRGWFVRTLSRRGHSNPPEPGITHVTGDLFDLASWRDLCANTVMVVHAVGILHEVPSKGITHETYTIESARLVAQQARDAGVPGFTLISAMELPGGIMATYARAKKAAEVAVRLYYPQAIVLKPSMVLRGNGWFSRWISHQVGGRLGTLVSEMADTVDQSARLLLD